MVWIYGGGWANGSASILIYWGDRLAKHGVIVVTIAYRVGALGFFSHPELGAEFSASHIGELRTRLQRSIGQSAGSMPASRWIIEMISGRNWIFEL